MIPTETTDDGVQWATAIKYFSLTNYVTNYHLTGFTGNASSVTVDCSDDKHSYVGSSYFTCKSENAGMTKLTFDGDVCFIKADLSGSKSLQEIYFNGAVSELEGVFAKNTAIERVYFRGDIPTFSGAATDYFANPENIIVYVNADQAYCDELKTKNVWKSFRNVEPYTEATAKCKLSVTADHASMFFYGNSTKVNPGENFSGYVDKYSQVMMGIYEKENGYKNEETGYDLAHVYVNGRDVTSMLIDSNPVDGYGAFKRYDIGAIMSDTYISVVGEDRDSIEHASVVNGLGGSAVFVSYWKDPSNWPDHSYKVTLGPGESDNNIAFNRNNDRNYLEVGVMDGYELEHVYNHGVDLLTLPETDPQYSNGARAGYYDDNGKLIDYTLYQFHFTGTPEYVITYKDLAYSKSDSVTVHFNLSKGGKEVRFVNETIGNEMDEVVRPGLSSYKVGRESHYYLTMQTEGAIGMKVYRNSDDITYQWEINEGSDDFYKDFPSQCAYNEYSLKLMDANEVTITIDFQMPADSVNVVLKSNVEKAYILAYDWAQPDESGRRLVDWETRQEFGAAAKVPGDKYVLLCFKNEKGYGEPVVYRFNGQTMSPNLTYDSSEGAMVLSIDSVGSYNGVMVEALFTNRPGELDTSKAYTGIVLTDESKQAELSFSYYEGDDNRKDVSGLTDGTHLFEMSREVVDSLLTRLQLWAPAGLKVMASFDGVHFNAYPDDSGTEVRNGVEGSLYTFSDNDAYHRLRNHTWAISVLKSGWGRQMDIALLGGKPMIEFNPCVVQDSGEREYDDGFNIETSQSIEFDRRNNAAEVRITSLAAMEYEVSAWDEDSGEPYDPETYFADHQLVVTADGEDISRFFTIAWIGYEGELTEENGGAKYLDAKNWVVGFKNPGMKTWTVQLNGDVQEGDSVNVIADKGDIEVQAGCNQRTESTAFEEINNSGISAFYKTSPGYMMKVAFNGMDISSKFKKDSDGYRWEESDQTPFDCDGAWVFTVYKAEPRIIEFADAEVKRICVENWDTDGDGELSYDEAAAVTTLNGVFNDQNIHTFDELQYFVSLTQIEEGAFFENPNLKSIVLPSSVRSVGSSAFVNCEALENLQLPELVSSIGGNAFNGCKLKVINIPKWTNSIGEAVMNGNSMLETIIVDADNSCYETRYGSLVEKSADKLLLGTNKSAIAPGVKIISSGAFYGRTIRKIEIPTSVESIEKNAFRCNMLDEVVSHIAEPFSFGENVFSNISSTCKLYVPSGTKQKYIDAGWTEDIFKGGIEEYVEERFDTNQDGKITIADVTTLVNKILGK